MTKTNKDEAARKLSLFRRTPTETIRWELLGVESKSYLKGMPKWTTYDRPKEIYPSSLRNLAP